MGWASLIASSASLAASSSLCTLLREEAPMCWVSLIASSASLAASSSAATLRSASRRNTALLTVALTSSPIDSIARARLSARAHLMCSCTSSKSV
jgi:hypothetical protein